MAKRDTHDVTIVNRSDDRGSLADAVSEGAFDERIRRAIVQNKKTVEDLLKK